MEPMGILPYIGTLGPRDILYEYMDPLTPKHLNHKLPLALSTVN